MSEQTNTSAFIEAFRLSFLVHRVDHRSDGLNSGWGKGSSHWRYEFRTLRNDVVLRGYFSQGSAHTEAPTDVEVLESLASDAMNYRDNEDVLLFAYEFGYEVDDPSVAKRVRRIYELCGEVHDELTELLGADGLEDLWNTPPDK